MSSKISVHGFSLEYEDSAAEGMRYLRDDLDYDEARVFFDQARGRGSCKFEDDNDRQFALSYGNGKYSLSRRP